MDEAAVIAQLRNEASQLSAQGKLEECIERMKFYEGPNQTADIRFSARMTRARCAYDAEDFDEAMAALRAIEREDLSSAGKFYVDKLTSSILQRQGRLDAAKKLLSDILARPETLSLEYRDDRNELLGSLVGVLAGLGEYENALKCFDEDFDVPEGNPVSDVVMLSKAYSLEMLKRYSEAEECLREIVRSGSGEYLVDIYYDLGNLYQTMGRLAEARSMFQLAKENLPRGTINSAQVDFALAKIR